jgi:hypothetical protein
VYIRYKHPLAVCIHWGASLNLAMNKGCSVFPNQKQHGNCCQQIFRILSSLPITENTSHHLQHYIPIKLTGYQCLKSVMGDYTTVRWLRRLLVSLSPLRPRFMSGSVIMGFVVDKVTLGQVSLQVQFSHQYHSTRAPYSYIIWGINKRPVGGRSSET